MDTSFITPQPTTAISGPRSPTFARLGVGLALAGLVAAMVSLINAVAAGVAVAGGNDAAAGALLAWSFGVATAGFGTAKLGIGLVLWAIVGRIRGRIDAMKEALPPLVGPAPRRRLVNGSTVKTDFGAAVVGDEAPPELIIHRASRILWAPMLAMGIMALYAGLVLSVVQAGNVAADPVLARAQGAWVQGLQFLGEALLLAGISFLLGTILGWLRRGGGEVQAAIGHQVRTLRMPVTAKIFIGLMALGVMVAIAQFGLYVYAATLAADPAFVPIAAWLGPLREFALGILLSGIVLALAAIARVLGFQFHRVTELIGEANQNIEVRES
jgi:hypothetical protein